MQVRRPASRERSQQIFEVVLPQGHAADNDEAAVAIQSGGVVVGRRTYGWLGQESNQPRPVHSHMQGSGRLDTWTTYVSDVASDSQGLAVYLTGGDLLTFPESTVSAPVGSA